MTQSKQGSWIGRRPMLGLALAVALTGAASIRPALAEDTLTFGAALSLTGKMATESIEVQKGYDFYVRHINERGGIKLNGKMYKVAIKYYDDESNPATSVKLYERLINEDGIKLLLGPYSSGVTMAVSAVAEKYHLPMVVAHAASQAVFERKFRYLFATLTAVDQYTSNYIQMAAEKKVHRVALLAENDLLPKEAVAGAGLQAKAAGLEVVYNGSYPTGTKDFSSMVQAMKAATPDMVIGAGYTGDMIVLIRQAGEQGFRPNMMGVLLGPTLPGFINTLGPLAEGVLEPIQWSPRTVAKDAIFGWTVAQFVDIYKKETGLVPDYHPPQSMAALEVFQHAIETTNSLDPEKLRDAIAATNMETVYGPIRFNEKGQNIAKGMTVVQVQGGKPVEVYPTAAAAASFVYPMPAAH